MASFVSGVARIFHPVSPEAIVVFQEPHEDHHVVVMGERLVSLARKSNLIRADASDRLE